MARKRKERIVLPDDPSASEIGVVDRWLLDHDDRPLTELITNVWDMMDDDEKSDWAVRVLREV